MGEVYYSPNAKVPMEVTGRHWYANDCSVPFITFINLEATYDKPVGHSWVLEESQFLRKYLEKDTA